jgi:hypothetical protein
MDLAGLAQFTIDACRRTEEGVVLTGHFSHLRGVRNDGGWLYRTDAPAIVGTLSRVPAAPGEPVEFRSPDDEMAAGLAPGQTYPWIDIYWQAYHVGMILAGRSEPRRFVAEAAHYFRQRGVVGWQPVTFRAVREDTFGGLQPVVYIEQGDAASATSPTNFRGVLLIDVAAGPWFANAGAGRSARGDFRAD